MDFEEPREHSMIRSTAEEIADEYGPEYWREKEEEGEFAADFWDELGDAGFHGLLVPEEYGGAGMGMQEMGTAMETLCAEGCGMAGTWYLVLTAGMATVGIKEHGTEEQKERYLPGIADGSEMFCVGITEPDAGTNTLNIETEAEKDGDEYVVSGKKCWITFSDVADHIMLVTRTTPRDEVDKPTDGITLFLIDMDDSDIEVSPIPKHGMNYSNSCEVFFKDVRVPKENALGEVGDGWWNLVDTLNPERIGFSAAATGIGKLAAKHAVDYSNEREVFDGPIGKYQSVQFPITEAYAQMETAALMRQKASWMFDNGVECGYETNVSKAFGGWGYAKEYDVERWWREINLTRLAPVTQQMAYNHIAQELGFPKSY
ncbi:MAG: acyl-CoA dehydrogenase family protein [Halobacteria archaeon]|nr:acyl-CoA dehydrogenase family protein [Halobacteria archaeon]